MGKKVDITFLFNFHARNGSYWEFLNIGHHQGYRIQIDNIVLNSFLNSSEITGISRDRQKDRKC